MKTNLEIAAELISDVIKNLEDMQGEWVAVQPTYAPKNTARIKTNVAILELVLESLNSMALTPKEPETGRR